MKKFTAIFFLLLIHWGVNAQNIKIHGIVMSKSAPLPEATIQFAHNDTVIQSSGMDAKGAFAVYLNSCDSIKATVKVPGYMPLTLMFPASKGDVDLDRIVLPDKSVELGEVTVNGTGIIEKIDKSVIIPTAETLKRSLTIFDLLADLNLAELQVNRQQRTASINGSGIVYKINGVPKKRQDVLALNPNNILRIEYVNRPTIRYMSDGTGGIINFILKPAVSGGSFYEDLSGSYVGSLNNVTQISLNHKKSEFTLNYTLDWRKYGEMINDKDESYLGDGFSAARVTDDKGSPMRYADHTFNATYTYQHDPSSMFVVKATQNFMPHHGAIYANVSISENGAAALPYDLRQNVDSKTRYTTVDMFYNKGLSKGGKLEMNMVGYYQYFDHNRSLFHTYGDNSSESYLSGVESTYKSLIGEIAFEKPLKNITYRVGAKNSYAHSDNDYRYPSESKTQLTRNNAYAYGEVSGKLKKVGYSLGTGLYVLSLENDTQKRTFVNNNTTVNLRFSMKQKYYLRYYFSYYPGVPSLSQMDNISQVVDKYNVTSGNPKLETSNSLYNYAAFTYSHNNVYASLSASYWHCFHPLLSDISYIGGTQFETRAINGNYRSQASVKGNFNIRELWHHFSFGANASLTRYTEDNYTFFHHTLNGVSLSLNASYYTGHWKLSASYNPIKTKSLYNELITTTYPNYYVSLQYQVKQLSVFVGGSFLFAKQGYQYDFESLSKVHPYTSYSTIRDNANWITVGFNYRMNFGRIFKSGKKTLNNRDKSDSAITIE